MGKIMQRGMVRKRSLEIALSMVEPHPRPKPHLEQYTIPPEVAAEILFIATYVFKDIEGKRVIDLGCGTGRLAIGAALLGAKEVVGVDIDRIAVETAKKNAEKMDVEDKIHWIIGDIKAINGVFDTVLQNPPFGVQRRGADRKFLKKALELGKRIYSLHKSGKTIVKGNMAKSATTPRTFITKFIERYGGKVITIQPMEMTLPMMFKFHRKRRHRFKVDLYVIEKKISKRFIDGHEPEI